MTDWTALRRMGEEARARVASEPLRPVSILGQIEEAREMAARAQWLHRRADDARGEPERCARLRREAVDLDMAADRLCPVEYR